MKPSERIFTVVISLFSVFLMQAVEPAKKAIYLNTAYSFQERAADLVSRMTLEEKQSQLGNTMPAIPRLGINSYDVWGEALHGVLGRTKISGKTATSFPNSVAVGASWDPELVRREASVISEEARGFNFEQIFTLTFWSPVVEPMRDPRWGRTGESFGEDPFLVSKIAGGFIRGMMGNDPNYLKAVPCGKHFVANNTEFNRLTANAVLEERDMREFYLLPYRTTITQDKLPSIMSAYSATNGIPMSAHKFLVDTIAKRTYGLNGYVTGDCDAVVDIYSGHKYAKDNIEAAAMGLKGGVDSDCGSCYQTGAIEAIKRGLITEADIDKALTNFFTIRMRTGEFDPKASVPYANIKPSVINDPTHHDLAIEIATKTPVLLKNNVVVKTGKKPLPIDASKLKKIAVLGPQIESVELGPYSGQPEAKNRISPLAGIRSYIRENNFSAEVVSHRGGNSDRTNNFFNVTSFATYNNGVVKNFDATKFNASAKDVLVSEIWGSGAVKGIKDGDWTAYNNVDLTNLDSLRINVSLPTNIGGVIEARIGSSTGNMIASAKVVAPARMASMKVNTLGIKGFQTLVFVYRALETPSIDQAAINMAASSDVAVVFVGTNDRTAGEASDRFTIDLPGNQYDLIKAVAAVNPNTVVVMQSLGMVEVDQFKDIPNVAGIIWTGFNGEAQGTAIARILFGEVNPGGKLNATWYKSLRDLPEIEDYNLRPGANSNGRTYWYFNKDVSYEFGYGLSYTTFAYSNFRISKPTITPNDKFTIRVDVTNTGSMDGDEVIQIYVKTPDSPASLQRPLKRLKGFRRATIAAGQTKTVEVELDAADLWFWDSKNDKITFDPGKYIFEIGVSSKDIKGQVEATVSGAYNAVLRTVVADCGRVILRSGEKAQTRLTASLSDDSFYDVTKAKVEYFSSNPNVATVDANGLVLAKSVGVALITATVTINGVSVSDSYPVKVMPNLKISKLTINGKALKLPETDATAFSVVAKTAAKALVVQAVPVSKNVSVSVVQATAVPGTASVVLTDFTTLENANYVVNFGDKAVSDEFNNKLGKQWNWVRENNANWSLNKKSGSLVITGQKGDISQAANNAANLLLQPANTDWTMETKLTANRKPSASSAQNAGVVGYQDDDNFVKFVFTANTGRRGLGMPALTGGQNGFVQIIAESNGVQKSSALLGLDGLIKSDNTLVLKLVKTGNLYTAMCSSDGVTFKEVGTLDIVLNNIKAGLLVCDGVTAARGMRGPVAQPAQPAQSESPFEVAFDFFRITSSGMK